MDGQQVQSTPTESSHSNDAYTVAWICALHIEHLAGKIMLDKEHGRPQTQHCNDFNVYRLGKIGDHFIVMAGLPDGEYGTHSANTVTAHLLMSFKHIRFGLMVGIGGGLPSSERDIRLGDVAVSVPSRNASNSDICPGIVSYMRGSTNNLRGFRQLRPSGRPPQILLNAVSALQTTFNRVNYLYTQTIKECIERNSELSTHLKEDHELENALSYPGASKDVLFSADQVHLGEKGDCRSCLGQEGAQIERKARRDENPRVHRGVIASSDILVKDPHERDQIARQFNAICVEMEGAGLQNFPSIIIRGISDYADSHKNDTWKQYSALTAAAYARELLLQIVAADRSAQACDYFSSVGRRGQSQTQSTISALQQQMHKLREDHAKEISQLQHDYTDELARVKEENKADSTTRKVQNLEDHVRLQDDKLQVLDRERKEAYEKLESLTAEKERILETHQLETQKFSISDDYEALRKFIMLQENLKRVTEFNDTKVREELELQVESQNEKEQQLAVLPYKAEIQRLTIQYQELLRDKEACDKQLLANERKQAAQTMRRLLSEKEQELIRAHSVEKQRLAQEYKELRRKDQEGQNLVLERMQKNADEIAAVRKGLIQSAKNREQELSALKEENLRLVLELQHARLEPGSIEARKLKEAENALYSEHHFERRDLEGRIERLQNNVAPWKKVDSPLDHVTKLKLGDQSLAAAIVPLTGPAQKSSRLSEGVPGNEFHRGPEVVLITQPEQHKLPVPRLRKLVEELGRTLNSGKK